MHDNEMSGVVVDDALMVHHALGPGLLESVYRLGLTHELSQGGLSVERQVPIAIGAPPGEGLWANLIVEGKVLLELKSVKHLTPLHRKQSKTYLCLTGLKPGLLLNFGAAQMKTASSAASTGWKNAPWTAGSKISRAETQRRRAEENKRKKAKRYK